MRTLHSVQMTRGITKTPRPPRYNPDFVFPDKLSPYYEVLNTKTRELMVGGPAGTAKTHHCVMKGHKLACIYPKSVGVFIRKVKESIKRTIIPTYYDVLGYNPMQGKTDFVLGFGNTQPSEFQYANGSQIFLIGLNDPKQLDSVQADWFYVNQAEELEESDWEIITTRNRGNNMPYRIVFGDCNPSHPLHFLCPYEDNENRRQRIHYVPTRHEDNPAFYCDGEWTVFGDEYVNEDLETLTGLNYDRYRLGLWRAPEGAVFVIEKCHILPYLPWDREEGDPHYEPIEAYAFYRGMDFGMHPSPSVNLWLVEHKQTKDLIVAKEWRRLNVDTIDMAAEVQRNDFPRPVEGTITDNDENIKSILAREGIHTTPTKKGRDSIKAGLDLIQSKLENTRKGKSDGLYFYSQLECGRDLTLEQEKRPTNVIQEMRLLVWHTEKEEPTGEDHGIDVLRYYYLWRDGAINVPFFGEVLKTNKRPPALI